MNKEELMLVIENKNGLAISNECNVSTGKIVLNGIEITDEESWNKAIVSLNELEKENEELKEKINKAIEYIENNTYSSVATMKTILHLQNDELYDLLEILRGK